MNFQTLKRNFAQIPGWRTNRKIIVIESDDWGSIRMSSKESYQKLLEAGIPVNRDPYNKFDSLECKDDLTALFDVLRKFKDKNGDHPVITANTIVANPDFDKIKASNFEIYHYELFTKTLERSNKDASTFDAWNQGINENLFRPQFHGREHVNVAMWMKALQEDDLSIKLAFEHQIFGIPCSNVNNKRGNLMASFDFDNEDELLGIHKSIIEGLNIFEHLFGFRSKTIIAPCYVWSDKIDPILKNAGVLGYQGISYQSIPELGISSHKRKLHYLGESNQIGQRFLIRNAFFEPTHFPQINEISEIIKRMKIAFFWKKPLIIGSHRINYMGTLDENNRTVNLLKLERLLAAIIKECPDVEFMSSDDLVNEMVKGNNDRI